MARGIHIKEAENQCTTFDLLLTKRFISEQEKTFSPKKARFKEGSLGALVTYLVEAAA